jgi:hypothetical protein
VSARACSRVRWRVIVSTGFLITTWGGCAGESDRNASKPAGHAGESEAGQSAGGDAGGGGTTADGGGGSSGSDGGRAAAPTGGMSASGGSSAAGGTMSTGASAGTSSSTGGASGRGGMAGMGGRGDLPIPARWTCVEQFYGDGTCDCGCGALDVDCPDASAASCENCSYLSCSPNLSCSAIEPDDNRFCTMPPTRWRCSAELYRDGMSCDCGCGFPDPDCESSSVDACDECDGPTSCSAQPCPGLIDPVENSVCYKPTPPAEWTCLAGAYGDTGFCDCGCGVPDPDCRNDRLETCQGCSWCGFSCPDAIDPTDSTKCVPPPPGWICSPEAYWDSGCACGCGVPDHSCSGAEDLASCSSFPVEGCSGGNRAMIDPEHNVLCR